MTIPRELLRLSAVLAETPGGLPGVTHVGRNRAISTAYYAVFHGLARLCGKELVGMLPSRAAYQHLYRSVDHSLARTIFKKALIDPSASASMKKVAGVFIDLQAKRHAADYDPFFFINRRQIEPLLRDAEAALDSLDQLTGPERKLLAARLIGRTRN